MGNRDDGICGHSEDRGPHSHLSRNGRAGASVGRRFLVWDKPAGENTHCVLAAHNGLVKAKLFTDLDKLEVGDRFTLDVLNETFTYEVDQILVTLPEETEELYVQNGKDLVTLYTCTPYGVNTHRLLVRGHRVTEPEE